MRIEESVEIDRPLEVVFPYVSDVGNYPRWMAHVLDVRKAASAPPQTTSFVVAIKSVGRRFETPYERTSFEPDHGYADRALGGPIPNQRWESTFHQVRAGTRYTRAVEVESRGWLKLLEPLQKRTVKRQLREDLQTLKQVLEAGGREHPAVQNP